MDSASLRSLTPLLDGIDRWVELAPLLPIIISLELVLSADNAVALASITKNLNENSEKYNISLFKVILLLSVTDLAFSIDSITAAVAISDQFLLVITGAIIGVIALRFTSGLFIKWLEIYINLEKAGYIAVGLIGLKLIIQLVLFKLVIPEYLFFLVMLFLFIWGFSKKNSSINNV